MSRAWKIRNVDPAASVAENARRVLAVRVAEFYSFAPAVPHPELTEALHDLRIAGKRLRYTLELFRPWLAEEAERQIERLKAIQNALGALHDHDVRIAVISEELARFGGDAAPREWEAEASLPGAVPDQELPPDALRRGLLALLDREQAARQAAFATFRELWDRFAAEGMRAELVRLSAAPVREHSAVEEVA